MSDVSSPHAFRGVRRSTHRVGPHQKEGKEVLLAPSPAAIACFSGCYCAVPRKKTSASPRVRPSAVVDLPAGRERGTLKVRLMIIGIPACLTLTMLRKIRRNVSRRAYMTTGGRRLNLDAVRAPLACVAAFLHCWQVGRICGAGAGRAALTPFFGPPVAWEKTLLDRDQRVPSPESGRSLFAPGNAGMSSSLRFAGSRWSRSARRYVVACWHTASVKAAQIGRQQSGGNRGASGMAATSSSLPPSW